MKKAEVEITKEDVAFAAKCASKCRKSEKEVVDFFKDFESNVDFLYSYIKSGKSVKDLIKYRYFPLKNNNGKKRDIAEPNFTAMILQYIFVNKMEPIYRRVDNYNGLNCKKKCGITAKRKRFSVVKKIKHYVFDLLEYNYYVKIDQRKCYNHIRPKVARKALKEFVTGKEFIDFSIDAVFLDNSLPIGTPSSPLMHHIVMFRFDEFAKSLSKYSVRYADDNFILFRTKEEASAAKWRIKNFWWYNLQIRAKRHTVEVGNTNSPTGFAGYIFNRNDKSIVDHNKGYVLLRDNILNAVRRCNNDKSYSSYFGIAIHSDSFNLLKRIEKEMDLRELTKKVKIERSMDADSIDIKALEGRIFDIHDYDLRTGNDRKSGWIKFLINIEENGKKCARVFSGNYSYMIEWIMEVEKFCGPKMFLHLTNVELESNSGWTFKGSTKKMDTIPSDYIPY